MNNATGTENDSRLNLSQHALDVQHVEVKGS